MLVKMARWGPTPWTCLNRVAYKDEGQWRTILTKGAFIEIQWEYFEKSWRMDGWGEERDNDATNPWTFTVAHAKPRNTVETIAREVLALPWDRSFITKKPSQYVRIVIDAHKWLTEEDWRTKVFTKDDQTIEVRGKKYYRNTFQQFISIN